MNSHSDVVSLIHCSYDQPPAKPSIATKSVIESSNDSTQSKSSRKGKRRVRFPDGEVISDYLEPFKPVPDNCTSEELITAYLESCFQYKVSPIEFLLEQLKGIDLSICNERYSRLSLKGIRLNRSHVETLEEIFRRVHFRELDFENTYLDDQSAVALFDMLLHYETCHELHISLNLDRFHPSLAWARCVTFMRRSGELRRFALSHTPLTIGNFLGINFFGLCLNSLSLRDCNLSGQALFGLVRWLRLLISSPSLDPPTREKSGANGSQRTAKRPGYGSGNSSGASCLSRRSRHWRSVLTTNPITGVHQPSVWELKLDVAQNKLNATDAETLLALVRHQLLVPQIPADVILDPDLRDSGHNGDASYVVVDDACGLRKEWLPVGGIGFLAELDLSNNSLGDDGLRVICTGLLQSYRTRLRTLHSECPPVTTGQEVTCSSTAEATEEDSDSSSPAPASPQPPTPVEPELQMTVRGLERLSVANNGLTAAGMQSMALALMQTPLSLVSLVGGLVSLDLSHNPGIRDEGVELLCEGLIRNHSLKELYLRAIRMSFTGIFALSSFLSESKCLRMLDIRSNHINLAALMALSKTLSLNHTLTSLLSDARNMTTAEEPLIATDAELILYLIDEIDQCLRRNRALHQQPSPVEKPKGAELPSSTSSSLVDIEAEPATDRSPESADDGSPDCMKSDCHDSGPEDLDLSATKSVEAKSEPSSQGSDSSAEFNWSEKKLVDLRDSFEVPELSSSMESSSPPVVGAPFEVFTDCISWPVEGGPTLGVDEHHELEDKLCSNSETNPMSSSSQEFHDHATPFDSSMAPTEFIDKLEAMTINMTAPIDTTSTSKSHSHESLVQSVGGSLPQIPMDAALAQSCGLGDCANKKTRRKRAKPNSTNKVMDM